MLTQKQNLLRVTEIYPSIQGEAAYAGHACVFVRLTGCPLRCKWCDTVYSFAGGSEMTIEEIISKIKTFNIPWVELTGGEPLAQPQSVNLAQQLIENGFKVMIETSGSESIRDLPSEVHIIMDIKCPDSGMVDRNRWENIDSLKKSDEIKFVIASRADFEWALTIVSKHHLSGRVVVLFSPAFALVKPSDLSRWIIEEAPQIKLNLQQHKYIWHPRAKGV